MKGVILAAGISSRLRPLTDSTPKCLLDLGGKTILGRTLENLRANNVTKILIVTGYREHQIREFVSREFPDLAVQFLLNEQFASTNNIYSLWLTRDQVLGHDILLLDSDIVFDSRILGLLLRSAHENCLAVTAGVELGSEEIKVRIGDQGYIVEISKEVEPAAAIGESIGIERFGPRFLSSLFAVLDRKILVENNVNQFYEAAFQEVIGGPHKIFPEAVGDYRCMEIDTPDDIEAVRGMVIPHLQ